MLYQIGRRMGFFRGPDDLEKSPHLDRVKLACEQYGVTPENVDTVIDELVKLFF
jgi:phosphoglycolate phosphatase-like HAD superfamily hydrolase